MRRARSSFVHLSIGIVLAAVAVLLQQTPAFAASSQSPELTVYLKSDAAIATVTNELVATGASVKAVPILHEIRLRITSGKTVGAALTALNQIPGVDHLEVNGVIHAAQLQTQITPNDTQYAAQSWLPTIQMPQAWDYTTGSSSVTVAVLDSGIEGDHPDLVGRVIAGYDIVDNIATTAGANSDDNGHGTLVAGVIGANGNNSTGIAGIDWHANIMPVKVLDNTGSGFNSDLASGIRWAADNGAKVINMSLGGSVDSSDVSSAVGYAQAKGVLLVAASGNNGDATILYPAKYPYVVAVGSVNSSDVRSSFSNYGTELSLVAPGENIESTNMSGGYSTASGTSLATPMVSGAASLIFARNPGDTFWDVRQALLQGVSKVSGMGSASFTNSYGFGRLNVSGAITNTPNYAATLNGQSGYPTLVAGQSANLTVSFVNTGKTVWRQDTPQTFTLGTSHGQDRISPFIRDDLVTHQPSGWVSANRIRLTTTEVDPGQVGTFSFWITVPAGMSPGTYREYFQPVVDGVGWLPDMGLYWNVTVNPPANSLSWGGQSGNVTLSAGQSAQFTLNLKNTGNTTWNQSTFHLGTSHNQDRISSFIREGDGPSGWTSPNRILMQESSVAPGEVAHFVFWMKTPSNLGAGTYREYFQPVVDGVGWLQDLGVYWDIAVPTPTPAYQDSWGGQSGNVTLSAGQSAQFTLNLKNTGTATWTPGVFHLGTSHNQDRISSFIREGSGPSGWTSPNRIQLQESSVAPGDVGHFVFWMKVPAGMASGTYREYFQPVADGIGWMSDLGIYWDITVH